MKILFITPNITLNRGGVERHVLEISKILARQHEVTILTESSRTNEILTQDAYQTSSLSASEAKVKKKAVKSSFFMRKKNENIKLIYLEFGSDGFFKKFVIWYKLLVMINVIKNYDVIHVHDVFIWVWPLRIILFSKKFYLTSHGYEGYPISFKSKIVRKVSHLLSDGSINVGRYLEKWYGVKSDLTTYGGVEESELKTSNVKKTVKSTSSLNILFIGRLEEINSLSSYIKVIRKLRKKRVKIIFNLFGDGSMKKKAKIVGNVITQRERLKKLLNNSNLVFSSSYLSMLEALICKKRIFSLYSDPVRKDYLLSSPFNGFIDVSNSPSELLNKLLRYNPNSFDEKSDLGYHWAKKQTWGSLVKSYLKLWKVEVNES